MTTENTQKTDEILNGLKGTLQSCLVVGFDNDGNYIMSSSLNNIPMMHWLLNKSVFEMSLFEKKNEATENAKNEKTPESDVDTEASDM